MDYSLEVQVDGDVRLNKKLVTVQQGLGSFRPLWPSVTKWFSDAEQVQFSTEGRGHWPPLAASTVKKRGSSHPILHDTGALERSLVNPSHHVEGEDSIELGTSLRVNGRNLGLLHQRGTSRMPSRPPIFPIRDELGGLRALFHRYILGLLMGSSADEQAA